MFLGLFIEVNMLVLHLFVQHLALIDNIMLFLQLEDGLREPVLRRLHAVDGILQFGFAIWLWHMRVQFA